MIQHPQASDPVTAQGLEHIDNCPECRARYLPRNTTYLPKEPAMPRMQPEGSTTIKYQPSLPNINRVEPHTWCISLRHDETFSSRQGDVRVCKHGKVQVRTETYSRRIAGPSTDWWRDLHPVFTPILWRRAKAALGQAR